MSEAMSWFATLTGYVAPFFIVASPIISYSDQIISMHRNKTSAGFSLDIPLIMLVASFLRIFYWPYKQYDMSLLIQSILMVIVQVLLLKVALDHRPAPPTKGGEAGLPFAGANEGIMGAERPYGFWQWRSPKPYWQAVLYFVGGLLACEIVLSQFPTLYALYANCIGPLGLAIEATLPIPQILSNFRTQSSKGLRLSVLVCWIGGDTMKIYWFFTSLSPIPWAFKVCGVFQGSCDFFLGAQHWMYNRGEEATVIKEHPMSEWTESTHRPSRSLTPTRRPAPFSDAEED